VKRLSFLLTPSFLLAAALAPAASAQLTQHVGPLLNPTHVLDFDTPPAPTGAIAGNSSVFTDAGIASVQVVGQQWFDAGDELSAGAGSSGRALVATGGGAGVLSIANVGQPLSHTGLGGGFELALAAPTTRFAALFVDQDNFPYVVEVFDGPASLATGQFFYAESAPFPPHHWVSAAPFDRIRITFPTSIGVGLDRLAFDEHVPVPTGYCTAGTSSNGCVPSLDATAQPTVGPASCVLLATSLEGQKSGLFFYGVDNAGFSPSPWGSGSSFLCVKPPTQRTTPQSSQGTAGACNGALTLDWTAWQLAHPAALGQPWSAGDEVYVQAWYRDPPAPKSTNLTAAIELTYLP
jgi:hypothetical protein